MRYVSELQEMSRHTSKVCHRGHALWNRRADIKLAITIPGPGVIVLVVDDIVCRDVVRVISQSRPGKGNGRSSPNRKVHLDPMRWELGAR